MPDLVIQKVGKTYPTASQPLVVLRDASLMMKRGDATAIIGPSGSGKSTLLQILGTLEPPTSGSVLLEGQNPFSLDEAKLAAFRNQKIGFIFQDHHLLPHLNVFENVLVPALAHGSPTEEQTARATTLLSRVGLAERLTHRPAELSGGERQRVAVARALLNQPVLVLADEPTGSLDRTNARQVAELLASLARDEHAILVVVTHSSEMASMMPRRFEIDNGILKDCGEKTSV
jgi:lipoprotein-releasing system ATP-binding protein